MTSDTAVNLNFWRSVATWTVAGATVLLAAVAVFQQTIRSWFYTPILKVTGTCVPPDCLSVPMILTFSGVMTEMVRSEVADAIYFFPRIP